MKFDLYDLELFNAVASLGSFTKAADSLHVAQPVLSRRIRDMEARLGVHLFDRTTRSVEITEAGKVVKHYAKSILEPAEELERALTDIALGEQHTVSIGYGSNAQFDALLRLAAATSKENPDIRIRPVRFNAIDRLSDGTLDAAFVMEQDITGFDWVSSLPADLGGLSVFMAAGHPLSLSKEMISLEALKEEKLLLPCRHQSKLSSARADLFEQISSWLAEHGVSSSQIEMADGAQSFSVRILTEHKCGIMPDSSAVINSDCLCSRRLLECRSGFGIVMAWRKIDDKTANIQALKGIASRIFML